MILTFRTDKPEAELGLFEDGAKAAYDSWTAHRQLGTTLHERTEVFLQAAGIHWDDVTHIIFYEGPGSFTGLRIGASVVNAYSYSYEIPVINTSGDDWIAAGHAVLDTATLSGAKPEYGADAFTTKPRK